jgi:ATP-dependent DNA helicase RecG
LKIDLATLTSGSESETLEFKESFDSKVLETIGAFANANGGTILIGVRDDGHINGIVIGSNSLEEWAQKMQAKIQPRFLPSITTHKHGGRTVAVITVERADSLISVDGRFFKRVGKTNQVMSPEELRQRLVATGNSTWDRQIEKNATMEDLDSQAVDDFIFRVRECGRKVVPKKESAATTLRKLGLVENGCPTRAALLLLGSNPQRIFMSAYIKAGRFKSPTDIIDDKEFHGTLFQQLDDTMAWFRDRLQMRILIGSKKLPGLPQGKLAERQDVWEYPLDALREAMANALCHRDYFSGAAIMVRLYDDHLTISNPGPLFYKLSADDLLREHDSYPPNKLIAESFFNVGLIERWGGGTLLIADALNAQGQSPPVFDAASPYTFKLTVFTLAHKQKSEIEKMGLNERQLQALDYLRKNQTITSAIFQELFDASKPTATRDLSELVNKGLIIREGKTGKGTNYRMAERFEV